MSTYDDLRKTQAEVDLQSKLRSVEPLHKASNAASLKLETARQATPEAAPQPADYLPQNPLRNMTTEQVVGFNRATGAWDEADGQKYLQAQAGRSHNDQLLMNKEHTRHARAFVQEQRAQEMSAPEVAKLYEQHGMKREAEAFERQQQNYAHGHDDEGGEQHRLEQARAALKVEASAELRKAQQAQGLEARVDAFRATQATQARQPTAPEATKAPEKPVRPQEPPRVAVATMDGGRVAQEREAMRELAKRQWLEQFKPKPQPDTPGLEREHDGDRPRTRGR